MSLLLDYILEKVSAEFILSWPPSSDLWAAIAIMQNSDAQCAVASDDDMMKLARVRSFLVSQPHSTHLCLRARYGLSISAHGWMKSGRTSSSTMEVYIIRYATTSKTNSCVLVGMLSQQQDHIGRGPVEDSGPSGTNSGTGGNVDIVPAQPKRNVGKIRQTEVSGSARGRRAISHDKLGSGSGLRVSDGVTVWRTAFRDTNSDSYNSYDDGVDASLKVARGRRMTLSSTSRRFRILDQGQPVRRRTKSAIGAKLARIYDVAESPTFEDVSSTQLFLMLALPISNDGLDFDFASQNLPFVSARSFGRSMVAHMCSLGAHLCGTCRRTDCGQSRHTVRLQQHLASNT